MDADEAADLQTDDEMTATPEAAAAAHTDARLLDTHTCLPGIIVSFDAQKQTAQVQPAIKRIFIDVGPVDLPICVDVPVQFPRGGNFVLTFPVAPGDECLLVFSERAIDFWWDQGGVQLPSEFRLHDLSDAFAIMGVSSKPKMVSNFSTDAAELRSLDGSTKVRLEGGQVFIGGVAGAEAALMGTTYRTKEDLMLSAWSTAMTAVATACSGATTPANTMSAVVLVGGLLSAMKTAIDAFQASASTYLATKTKVV